MSFRHPWLNWNTKTCTSITSVKLGQWMSVLRYKGADRMTVAWRGLCKAFGIDLISPAPFFFCKKAFALIVREKEMNGITIEDAVYSIKEMIERAIKDGGVEGKNN